MSHIKRLQANGFTLIELIMVIAIASLLIGIGVPSFQALIDDSRVTSSTNSMVEALSYARVEAVRRGASVTVNASGTSNGSWVNGFTVSQGTTPLRQYDATDSGVTINSSSSTTFTFRANGFTSNANETFVICPPGGGSGREITLATSGRVSVNSDYTCN